MSPLEQYLNRATRGLWGQKRRDLRDELHGNLAQHALNLQLTGLSPDAALDQALVDFGPPDRVSVGMLRVYALPRLLIGLLVVSGLGTMAYGLSTLPRQTAVHAHSVATPDQRAPAHTEDP